MDDSGEPRLAPRHVVELSDFFAAHDRWLLGTLANKDVSEFRRQEAFRRRQPDIQSRDHGQGAAS